MEPVTSQNLTDPSSWLCVCVCVCVGGGGGGGNSYINSSFHLSLSLWCICEHLEHTRKIQEMHVDMPPSLANTCPLHERANSPGDQNVEGGRVCLADIAAHGWPLHVTDVFPGRWAGDPHLLQTLVELSGTTLEETEASDG